MTIKQRYTEALNNADFETCAALWELAETDPQIAAELNAADEAQIAELGIVITPEDEARALAGLQRVFADFDSGKGRLN